METLELKRVSQPAPFTPPCPHVPRKQSLVNEPSSTSAHNNAEPHLGGLTAPFYDERRYLPRPQPEVIPFGSPQHPLRPGTGEGEAVVEIVTAKLVGAILFPARIPRDSLYRAVVLRSRL